MIDFKMQFEAIDEKNGCIKLLKELNKTECGDDQISSIYYSCSVLEKCVNDDIKHITRELIETIYEKYDETCEALEAMFANCETKLDYINDNFKISEISNIDSKYFNKREVDLAKIEYREVLIKRFCNEK